MAAASKTAPLTEVSQLDLATLCDENVLGLDVTVQLLAVVQVLQRLSRPSFRR